MTSPLEIDMACLLYFAGLVDALGRTAKTHVVRTREIVLAATRRP
jgi:hypothetical protein